LVIVSTNQLYLHSKLTI